MSLQDRINNVKPYFISFKVEAQDSAAYAVVKFPQSWTVPDTEKLKENFKVQIGNLNGGCLCFVTEMANSTDCIFDALDYVIDFNRKVEERKGLLLEKVNELKDLFATETLDRLKTLKFVFESPKKQMKRTQPKKDTEVKTEQAEAPAVEEPKVEENAVEPQEKDNSLMSLAKTITGS